MTFGPTRAEYLNYFDLGKIVVDYHQPNLPFMLLDQCTNDHYIHAFQHLTEHRPLHFPI